MARNYHELENIPLRQVVVIEELEVWPFEPREAGIEVINSNPVFNMTGHQPLAPETNSTIEIRLFRVRNVVQRAM